MSKMIAGLDKDEQEQEVEITPEMIEAGTSVLCRMTTLVADEEFWAEEIYRAMAVRSPRLHDDSDTSREALPR